MGWYSRLRPFGRGETPREITTLLHAGGNALRLEVSTTLSNAMRAQGLSGDPDYASYSSRVLQPSGLIGPRRAAA